MEDGSAWAQYFDSVGDQYGDGKYATYFLRPVRAF
jgi:hypothetical protein